MKIVDRAAFLALPANTVYSKYTPCVFEDLSIKGDSLRNDWYDLSIADAIEAWGSHVFSDSLIAAAESGGSLTLDLETEGRDGLFDADQLFAVWEDADVLALIARLSRCVGLGGER